MIFCNVTNLISLLKCHPVVDVTREVDQENFGLSWYLSCGHRLESTLPGFILRDWLVTPEIRGWSSKVHL